MTGPRVVTTNEKYGSGHLEEAGGTWLVVNPQGRTNFVATNRTAAEAALYDKAAEHGSSPEDWELEVWAAQDTYPPDDEEGD